jgi:predicted MPP superfamily phosphohydrolase
MRRSRRDFLKSFGQVLAAGCLATVVAYEYSARVGSQNVVVERVQVPLKNLKSGLEGCKIVQMSDIHLYPYTQIGLVQEAVSVANALQPDLVVLTGDYVLQKAGSIFDLAPVLASLNARYGVFAIVGNHDVWTNVDVVRAGLEEAKISVLRNESIVLGAGSSLINLAGLDDGWSGKPDLKATLASLPANTPTILLAHEPDLADTFSLDGRVSLQLSGHTHGGQVRLPGIGAPLLPFLGRKYDRGLYNVNNMWLYTNTGIGVVFPFRFNCPPEVTEITLVGA